MADCIIAGGTESMSMVPTAGWKTVPSYAIAKDEPDYYLSMGLTAEAVANEYSINREDQDVFAFQSHQKAMKAIQDGNFKSGIIPITVEEVYVNEKGKKATRSYVVDTDEGVRADTTVEALAKLKPAFATGGSVTAGNSSQTSDGAAFAVVMSERMVNRLGLKPIGRLVNCASAGVPPRIMGIGPIAAIPKVLKQAGMTMAQIDLLELNEAFAAQALAVIRKLELNPEIINRGHNAATKERRPLPIHQYSRGQWIVAMHNPPREVQTIARPLFRPRMQSLRSHGRHFFTRLQIFSTMMAVRDARIFGRSLTHHKRCRSRRSPQKLTNLIGCRG